MYSMLICFLPCILFNFLFFLACLSFLFVWNRLSNKARNEGMLSEGQKIEDTDSCMRD